MARLLIVDDEKNIRANLASFFESIGHEAQTAENGRQARAMIEAAPFDLVLTDFRMAEMNGLELLTEIKKRRPECLVILMTAYATVENAVAAMKAGAFDYVTKPFSLEQIQHLAERALQDDHQIFAPLRPPARQQDQSNRSQRPKHGRQVWLRSSTAI
jgi:DNA-binding NtrC family response regulator